MTPAALRRQVALVGTALLAGLFVVVLGRPAEEAVPPVPPPVSTPRWQSAVVSVTRLRPETACEAGATGVAGVVHPVLPCGVKLEVSANGKDLRTEIVGLGPLQPLMADPEISDILVNRFDEIYIERRGRLEFVSNAFRDEAQLEQVIQKIVALVGREINIEKPLVDARMVDGSRANAVYAPVGGPTLCIRKFNRVRLALLPDERDPSQASWASTGGLSLQMGAFLEAMAVARANILIAGATGSGKSTLLRSIVSAFPEAERVITIENSTTPTGSSSSASTRESWQASRRRTAGSMSPTWCRTRFACVPTD